MLLRHFVALDPLGVVVADVIGEGIPGPAGVLPADMMEVTARPGAGVAGAFNHRRYRADRNQFEELPQPPNAPASDVALALRALQADIAAIKQHLGM